MDEELMQRIEANAVWEPNSGCHIWLAALVRDHATVKYRGENRYAHRVVWEHAHGPIPAGLMVLHKCGVSCCVSLSHLELGTRRANAADRKRHGGYLPNYGAGRTAVEPRRIRSAPFKRDAKVAPAPLDRDEALRLFRYDPATGVLSWRPRFDRSKEWNTRFAGKEAGSVLGNGYRYLNRGGKLWIAHRVIWLWMTGEWPPHQIDHINGDKLDNRWANLRLATSMQNTAAFQRLRSRNRSGYRGVSFDKAKQRWQAVIVRHGKRRWLGYFDTADAAAGAYLAADTEGAC